MAFDHVAVGLPRLTSLDVAEGPVVAIETLGRHAHEHGFAEQRLDAVECRLQCIGHGAVEQAPAVFRIEQAGLCGQW